MKRILFPLLLAAVFAATAHAANRDLLLTRQGTLYSISSVESQKFPGIDTRASRLLALSIVTPQQKSTTIVVPESLAEAEHTDPLLAYDHRSETLFVSWLSRSPSGTEVLLTTYRAGAWSNAIVISRGVARRDNLTLGVTRSAEDVAGQGSRSVEDFMLHVAWWERSADTDGARYTIVPTLAGKLREPIALDLRSFLDGRTETKVVRGDIAPDLLRRVSIFEDSDGSDVEIVFGSLASYSYQRVTMRPRVEAGKLRVPVGRQGEQMPLNRQAVDATGATVGFASSFGREDLALYFVKGDHVHYTLFESRAWSPLKSITIDENVSVESAIVAINRLLTAE